MRAGPFRLPAGVGGDRLQRDRPLTFQFDGTSFNGYVGDSLASALLANGVRTVGRSFKFHRPRGVYSCGFEEPNALLRLNRGARTIPIVQAPQVELREGLESFALGGWPSVHTDFARVLDFVAPLWAAGFYNKTFLWPSWHTYEPIIRRMAGLGRAPLERDPDRYDVRNLHCDVLVVGAGEAGLRAALAAAAAGDRVVLVEQGAELGGRCLWDDAVIEGLNGSAWVRAISERLESLSDVRILRRTAAVGYHDRDVVTLLEDIPCRQHDAHRPRQRYWIVRAQRVVLATGAIEQPLIFCNNDRPGIMLADAARKYLRCYGVAVGRRVVIATNNDSAYALARDLSAAGVTVEAILDTRHQVAPTLAHDMREAAISLLSGAIPIDTTGFGALAGVTVGKLSRDGTRIEGEQRFVCDALAVSGGWNPTLHLYAQARGRLTYDADSGALVPMTSSAFWPATRHPVIDIVGAAGNKPPIGPRVSPVGNTLRQWVDLRHDVTVADLELAVRENYASIEHVKRYTTAGMSVDQGKTSNPVTIEIVARLRGISAAETGYTTQRPPFVPVTLGAIASNLVGDHFAPSRLTAMHGWHVANRAVLEDFGEWKRPAAYLRGSETKGEAIAREVGCVRTSAGLFDASPLGKIEIHGPDAAEFLDRFYINNLATLKPGRTRYGLMLRESGVIFDDGTIVMMEADRFVVTTTSGNAGRVAAGFEEWHQCEWPELRVAIVPVTELWATVSLAGPKARDILSALDLDIDLTPAMFPHLSMREGRILGHAGRVYRVSFTGELTYEINVPTDIGQSLWGALMDVGRPFGLQPFGVDAMLALRLEKGFLHVGTDTDGSTVPDDVGWGKVAAEKKRDFIGKRSLYLPENLRPNRRQLIGLVGEKPLVVGSHLRLAERSAPTDGWITSAGTDTQTGQSIALAMLRGGRQQIGMTVEVHDSGRAASARVVNPPFLDPRGERMNA